MAANAGVMADFARLPTDRKVLVFVVIGLALGGLYWQFLWKPLNVKLEAARAENNSKAGMNKKLGDEIPLYEAAKARVKELTLIISENQKALPTESEVPAFFETLERKVTESGVEINKWKKLKEEPIETFVKVPVEIEINGTFMQIKRFFASLIQKGVTPVNASGGEREERERIVSIENLTLTSPVVKDRTLNLTAKFVAITYRQEDAAAVAPAKAPAKGAAPAPASSPASPKGAKARTEDALDKGDKANRNATGVDEAKTPADSKLKGGM